MRTPDTTARREAARKAALARWDGGRIIRRADVTSEEWRALTSYLAVSRAVMPAEKAA
jgi:hypothetical protein